MVIICSRYNGNKDNTDGMHGFIVIIYNTFILANKNPKLSMYNIHVIRVPIVFILVICILFLSAKPAVLLSI